MLPHPQLCHSIHYLMRVGLGVTEWLIDLECCSLPKSLRSVCDITIVLLSFHHPCTLPPYLSPSPPHLMSPHPFLTASGPSEFRYWEPAWVAWKKEEAQEQAKTILRTAFHYCCVPSSNSHTWSTHCVLGTHARPWKREVDCSLGEWVVCCLLSVFLYREGLALVSLFFEEYSLKAKWFIIFKTFT